MDTDKYNGFTNHITWLVYTWLTNTEAYYTELLDIYDGDIELSEEYKLNPDLIISDFIEERQTELLDNPKLPPNNPSALMFDDIINAALSQVDYVELANKIFDIE